MEFDLRILVPWYPLITILKQGNGMIFETDGKEYLVRWANEMPKNKYFLFIYVATLCDEGTVDKYFGILCIISFSFSVI
jgi:hypothetical protein